MGLRIDATSSADGGSDYPVPEPALEFAVLSTKAASEKKPVTLQCSIRCFFEFSLCLSRACLGKMMRLMYKWRKKVAFRT